MSLGKLQRLTDQAQRMRASLDKASLCADAADQTLTSFESNLNKLETARQHVRDTDNEVAAMLKVMGNFNVDTILGETGGGTGQASATTQKPKTDINGVTLNPEAKLTS